MIKAGGNPREEFFGPGKLLSRVHPRYDFRPQQVEMAQAVRETIEKVENKVVAPEGGLRALAAELNQRIRLNLRRRSDLQQKFSSVTGQAWHKGWRYEEVAQGP